MIRITLLGKPAINDTLLSEKQLKTLSLLVFFLYNKDKSFAMEEIFHALWEESKVTNIESAVKVALHRFLTTFSFLNEELIIFSNGKYQFNPNLEYTLDTDEFIELAVSEFLENKNKALLLYKGEFLGSAPSPLKEKYHNIYLDTLDAVLSETEPQDILRLTDNAINPDERIYIHRINAFITLERFGEAVRTYEDMYSKLMADGLFPSDIAINLYNEAIKKIGENITIHSTIDELAEKEKPTGCYIMSYNEFKETIRYFKSIGITGQVAIFKGDELPDTLGSADIATRISSTQYAVYLPFNSACDASRKINLTIILD